MLGLLDRLFGPIFAKEAVEIARRFRYYATRSLMGILLLIGAYRTIEEYGETVSVGGRKGLVVNPGHDKVRETKIAEGLLTQVSIMEILAVVILTPLFLSGTIAGERREGTLELLFTTHLTDSQILWGKFGSRVAVMLLVLVGGVPVLFLLMLLGGIDLLQLIVVQSVTLSVLLFVAGVALHFSAACRTPLVALIRTYLAVATASLVAAPLVTALLTLAFDRRNSESVAVGFVGSALAVAGAMIFTGYMVSSAAKLMRESAAGESTAVVPPTVDEGAAMAAAVDRPAARGAMWGPLRLPVDRNDPPLRENLWVFGVLLGAFVICTLMMFKVAGGGAADRLGAILVVIWVVVIPATLLAGVTNPLFSRRPGFFDLLLGTTLDQREIMQGAVWVSWPMLVRLYVVPWLLGILWIGGNPPGIILATLIGSLFGAVVLLVGNVVSLTDHHPFRRLGSMLLFLAVPTVVVWMYHPLVIEAPGLRVAAALLVVGAAGWLLFRRSTNPFAVAAMLLAVHLAFVAAATCLPMLGFQAVFVGRREISHVVELVNPFKWLWLLLWPGEEMANSGHWRAWSLAYLGSLAAYAGWLWWWTSRNFDRLAGRTRPTSRVSKTPGRSAGGSPPA